MASVSERERHTRRDSAIMPASDETKTQPRTDAPTGFQSWKQVSIVETEAGRMLHIEGWVFAVEAPALSEVRAVALERRWPAIFPIPRPDVARAFPSFAQACTSGFAIQIPQPPRAPFKIQLEAKRPNDKEWSVFARARSAPPQGVSAETEAAGLTSLQHPGFGLWFDEPLDWSKLPRRFRISGWCFPKSGEPVQGIRALIGGREYAGSYGVFRADVAEMHHEQAGTFKSGFAISAEAPRGRALLRLEMRFGDGGWVEVFRRKIRAPFINLRAISDPQLWEIGDYQTWIKRYDTLSRRDRRGIKTHIGSLAKRPLISIVMPVYNPAAAQLREAIDSVRAQLYPHWELCIVEDASPSPRVRPILQRYARRDPRIKVSYRQQNGGIAAASNDALRLTTGEFVALLDDDDLLAPAALYFVASEINAHPEAQLIYSDENKLDIIGRRGNAHFKPDWNRPLFLAQNFFSHLGVFQADLIKRIGFRAGFEGSQDYDLVLRCIEEVAPEKIRHIPRVLYHWRMSEKSAALSFDAKPHARAAAIKALTEHLERQKIAAQVTSSGDEDFRRIRYLLPNEKPRVSIVIPTRDLLDLLQPCVESILEKTTYPNFDLILVDNDSGESQSLGFLERVVADSRVRVLHFPGEFNFGQLNNFGVGEVESEFVALLNNDLTVITRDWLEEMVSQALPSDVGAVGARLLYPDDRIQHAGVILGGGGVAAHAHKGLPRTNHGYFSRAILAQEVSAATAACLLVRRKSYLEIGGFDEQHLSVAFNDVDFCLRLRRAGYRIIYTPYAEFYHHESASRGLEDTVRKNRRFEAETKYMHDTWGDALQNDPAYNPNLSLASADFRLAFPPRTSPPWKTK
ncbi:MAG TPA: glycosyltransferase family 2 protein [Chthoniobacterales bacterium]